MKPTNKLNNTKISREDCIEAINYFWSWRIDELKSDDKYYLETLLFKVAQSCEIELH